MIYDVNAIVLFGRNRRLIRENANVFHIILVYKIIRFCVEHGSRAIIHLAMM
jgi:hypothetical protein